MRNIDCDRAQEWIVADLDETLDDELRVSLEAHLAGCERCADAFNTWRALWSALMGDRQEDPGEAYWQDYRRSLNAKLDAVSLRRWPSWGFWGFGWRATAVLAPATLALVLMLHMPVGQVLGPQPVDGRTCQRLLNDLNEVYGPTTEETVSKAYSECVKSEVLTVRNSTAAGSALTWFEVEDDPITPFL
jgi:hypothetical protein